MINITLGGEEVNLLNTINLTAADFVQVQSQLGVIRTVLFVHHLLCASSHTLSDTSLVPYENIIEKLQK